ncbi:helix-turn-helix domain-containing protein [Enterococcus innesii]|uniref:helix-turn-helix domain-containing protein n=1 Tax=Enterococcus innesii TaxID=2839759 RepID=UPI003F852F9D
MINHFYPLIQQTKTRRWYQILDQFEEKQTLLTPELVVQTQCSTRTIRSDIKEMKAYFQGAILLFGDDYGYHFSLKDPASYDQKKQQLLVNEPVFFWLDQLIADIRKTNQVWSETLNVSTATFGRIKRQVSAWLGTHYDLRIQTATNQLQGEEAAIRQLMADLYFQQSLCPKSIAERTQEYQTMRPPLVKEHALIDPRLFQQWYQVFSWRLTQGHRLPAHHTDTQRKQRLAESFDQQVKTDLPQPEKAALFLLCLREEVLLDPSVQGAFLARFSSERNESSSIQTETQRTLLFLETYIDLLDSMFQLPNELSVQVGKKEPLTKQAYMDGLTQHYLSILQQVQHPVVLSFDLIGPPALKEWIQSAVRKYLQEKGYTVLEKKQNTAVAFLQELNITNHPQVVQDTSVICIPLYPNESEVHAALKKVLHK